MHTPNLDTLRTFRVDSIPTLDTVVLGALEFFATTTVPRFDPRAYTRPLVMGSANAEIVARMLFAGTDARFANVDTYHDAFETYDDTETAIVVSASGGKHAIEMARVAREHDVETILLSNNSHAPASKLIAPRNIYTFPKVREPYTYNTSSYMSMFLAISDEDTRAIQRHIKDVVAPIIPDTLSTYSAFFLALPSEFAIMRSMCATKFDELFGPKLLGRVFSIEEAKHAKTVVPSDRECFISFGVKNTLFGSADARIHIPLPDEVGPVAMLAVAYYVIGCIQAQFPPYFKDNIVHYTAEAADMFNHPVTPIVEA